MASCAPRRVAPSACITSPREAPPRIVRSGRCCGPATRWQPAIRTLRLLPARTSTRRRPRVWGLMPRQRHPVMPRPPERLPTAAPCWCGPRPTPLRPARMAPKPAPSALSTRPPFSVCSGARRRLAPSARMILPTRPTRPGVRTPRAPPPCSRGQRTALSAVGQTWRRTRMGRPLGSSSMPAGPSAASRQKATPSSASWWSFPFLRPGLGEGLIPPPRGKAASSPPASCRPGGHPTAATRWPVAGRMGHRAWERKLRGLLPVPFPSAALAAATSPRSTLPPAPWRCGPSLVLGTVSLSGHPKPSASSARAASCSAHCCRFPRPVLAGTGRRGKEGRPASTLPAPPPSASCAASPPPGSAPPRPGWAPSGC